MKAPGYTGGTVDRADRVRHDPALLAEAEADPRARLLVLHGLDPELDATDRLVWTTLDGAPAERLFLGYDDGVPLFAAAPLHGQRFPATRSPALFAMLDRFRAEDAALYAAARSLVDWHGRHGYCAVCGTATAIFRAGWARRCPNCHAEHFPRVDPVVIMLAELGDKVLLGRQPPWPQGRYSALAGFLEVGESIEEAVRREIFEEAGVRVGAVPVVDGFRRTGTELMDAYQYFFDAKGKALQSNIAADEVKKIRAKYKGRQKPFTAAELNRIK